MLFEEPPKFEGFPVAGFDTFAIRDSECRRRAIIESIHPALSALGEDLLQTLSLHAAEPLYAHLPRLDWPPGYQPFCTWLALSRERQRYQAGPQLSLGIHADHVAVRLGWDTSSDFFGRFEFLCRHGDLGKDLLELAKRKRWRFRVYASAKWPEGSRCVFESPDELHRSFEEVRKKGLWWEVGRRYGLPGAMATVSSADFGPEVAAIFMAMLPLYDRIVGDRRTGARQ